ncbi:hypothetical protein [Rosistilla oblonga]|uniref:Quinol:cytochrome C oxidoreductase n=1 Tax=Rosistilla oblonga TaxID=2527990 RepID=A0A518IWS8_9BACT|nr:hypothetical protein [Rosistilla oblonga]QDV57550.1 hypothetical protein Mal33_35600 [Rosistilla oblonga]
MTKEPNDRTLQLPESLSGIQLPLLAGGGIAVLVGVIAGLMSPNGVSHSLHAYLTAFTFCLTISLGAMFFVIIQHLSRAGWSASVRRVAEIIMAVIPLMAILFLPIVVYVLFFDHGALYPWNAEGWAELTPANHEKAKILNPVAYLITSVVVLAVWTVIVRYFWTNSCKQDETGDIALTAKMQRWSGPATFGFALSVSAAAFVWIMSLDPLWFSTMFGVYLFAGSMVSFFALMCSSIYFLQQRGVLVDEINEEHFHDLGKYTFGFIVFWAYIAFSQYMLIWYANIPEETIWFLHRQGDGLEGWSLVSLSLVLMHWLIPFFAVMSRHMRRWPKWMACWGVYILAMHYVDMYWVIMPEAGHENHLVFGGAMGLISSLLCVAGMFALFIGVMLRIGSGIPLVAAKDPRLPQALQFENI